MTPMDTRSSKILAPVRGGWEGGTGGVQSSSFPHPLIPFSPFFDSSHLCTFKIEKCYAVLCNYFPLLPATLGIPLPAPSFLAGSHPSALLPVYSISDQNYMKGLVEKGRK